VVLPTPGVPVTMMFGCVLIVCFVTILRVLYAPDNFTSLSYRITLNHIQPRDQDIVSFRLCLRLLLLACTSDHTISWSYIDRARWTWFRKFYDSQSHWNINASIICMLLNISSQDRVQDDFLLLSRAYIPKSSTPIGNQMIFTMH
jgi:hypothetical protein